MTTNVTISTNYIHPGKKLRVTRVNPANGQVYGEQVATQADIEAKGVPNGDGVKRLVLQTEYVHDGQRLVVEEAD